jgi:hypothetical protein
MAPPDHLEVTLAAEPSGARRVSVSATGPRSLALLAALRDAAFGPDDTTG